MYTLGQLYQRIGDLIDTHGDDTYVVVETVIEGHESLADFTIRHHTVSNGQLTKSIVNIAPIKDRLHPSDVVLSS